MRYFMASFGGLGSAEEVKLKDFLGENQFGFWHRVPGVWLITVPDALNVSSLLDMFLDEFDPFENKTLILTEFTPEKIAVVVPEPYHSWFEKHLGLEFGLDEKAGEMKADVSRQ